jgi:hypothetical protein
LLFRALANASLVRAASASASSSSRSLDEDDRARLDGGEDSMCSIVGAELALLAIGVSDTAMPAPPPDDDASTSKTGAAYSGAEDSTVTTVGDDVMV